MKQYLNNRFTLSSDPYNWILIDKKKGKKVKRSYFPSIKQLSRFIGELVAKESLGKAKVQLGDIRTIIPSHSSVIDQISVKLERYVDSMVESKKTKYLK